VIFPLFAFMHDIAVSALTPQVSSIAAASLQSGSCTVGQTTPAQPAKVRTSWTLANMDTSLYDTKLYENGVLVATPTGVLLWDKTIAGSVEYGNRAPWFASWTYRLDIVRKSDGQVVATRTSATFAQEYGGCTGSAAV
jgi:hypothetical protein